MILKRIIFNVTFLFKNSVSMLQIKWKSWPMYCLTSDFGTWIKEVNSTFKIIFPKNIKQWADDHA